MEQKILLIDDDVDLAKLFKKRIESKGAFVSIAHSAKEGLKILTEINPDLVLLDVMLPDKSGVEFVPDIKSHTNVPIIMISGHSDTNLIVSAIKAGASDYIQKPIQHRDLFKKINQALEIGNNKEMEKESVTNSNRTKIIGDSIPTQRLLKEISQVANSNATVLLRGESGTGKSMVAEIIHNHSSRNKGPLITINCAAIPRDLLESELFGHMRGSFTGAIKDKPGKFELANNGTLFLDEIGDLPLELQVKLLRVLQGKEFERIGGLNTIKVNTRIIAATNRNLEKSIQDKTFREDLFYRLNVLPVYIPSLRERKEDIELLLNHFLNHFCHAEEKEFHELSNSVLKKLSEYHWPGNIRELQNIMERAVILGHPPFLNEDDFTIKNNTNHSLKDNDSYQNILSIHDMEKQNLVAALRKSSGNITTTAKTLGVGRDTIYRRMKKHRINT